VNDLITKLATLLSPATLQFDLAAALVALVALLFSIITFVHQRRISIETLRNHRDNDIIVWLNHTIDVLVGVEFFLRDSIRPSQQLQFGSKRDDFLARLSASIDKGRLYFPSFTLDVISPEKPKPEKPKPHDHDRDILNKLVRVYDLIKVLEPQNASAIDSARLRLLLEKRAFMADARAEVQPQRRRDFLK
jgi:hypothetical protein